MGLIKLPEFIYKYISWDKEYHKKIILENKIFFSSVKKFNDPFDSTIPLRYDIGTDEQIYDLFIKLIRNDNHNLTDDEVKRIARNEMNYDDIRGDKRIQNTIDNQREIIATKYGIFSASYEFDSVLMWSHYSNLHKGLCVRFNCKKFKNYIENECLKNDWIIIWGNAEYSKDYPILNPFELNNDDLIMKSLLLKSKLWRYENEIRFILFSFPDKELKLPDGIINQIILGCKISPNDRQELIEFSKKKNIELIQAFRKDYSFGLGFVKVNE
ncbi:MAG: DUF2971 domain-containing protein [Bacteroidetes bacterium]|nr:DUF2971 domain-containing protein [Bacteroidota bacterium]